MKYNEKLVHEELKKATNLTELVEIKNKLSKDFINPLKTLLQETKDHNEKKSLGQEINQLKINLERDFLFVKNEFEQEQKKVNYQVVDTINNLTIGKAHILEKTNKEILDIFKELQFDIRCGDDIVSSIWNFDALNISKNHPARAMHDSFFMSDEQLLKTHNTSYSAFFAKLLNKTDDIRICSYGSVFRNDDDDATHSHQFMQIDLVWIKEGLNIANLKWIVDYMLHKLFGNEVKTRYRLSFFPFTEPSFEVDISCFNCLNKGCNICKGSGWIEVLGAGMLHQNVLKNIGINHNKYQGIAFGIGIERIAMLKHEIEDIRNFYTNDFNFLKQF